MTSSDRPPLGPPAGRQVGVGARPLSIADIAAVARRDSSVRLDDAGLERVVQGARFADLAGAARPLYGRSTGVGANRTVPVTGDPVAHALTVLRSHATSAGPARSPERVRAMLLIRLNQLTAGGSGVAPAVPTGLLEMIRADALPRIGELGSIGTGDLSALATSALALMGEGPTSRPLAAPVPFGAADGLAFISSNAATLADAALALASLSESVRASLVIAALTFHAVRGNAEAYSSAVAEVTPFPGAVEAAADLRALVGADPLGVRRDAAGSVLPTARIQDPFGLRALPQVNGPVADVLRTASRVVATLVNSPTENPLLRADRGEPGVGLVAHHGGFHYAYLQLAMDALALAVAQSGPLVLARLAMLIDPGFTGLTPFLSDGTPGASGVMACEYVAASALGSIRAAAVPAGLQSVSLSRGVEEDASFASLAAGQCLHLSTEYRQLLACELLAAVRANRMLSDRPSAGMVADVLGLCGALPVESKDRDLTDDLAVAVDLLPSLAGLLVPAAAGLP